MGSGWLIYEEGTRAEMAHVWVSGTGKGTSTGPICQGCGQEKQFDPQDKHR